MSEPSLTIRRAVVADAPALAAFAERVFVDWYAPDNEPLDMQLHVARTFGTALQRAEIEAAGARYLLALAGERIAGYAYLAAGPAPAAIAGPAPCEVRRFYVDREWHGRGVAVRLMAAVVEDARAAGARTLWLTAWDRNARAQAFYAKCGYVDVGSATFLLGRSPQTDRLLVRALEPD